jgi:hypothetical protein
MGNEIDPEANVIVEADGDAEKEHQVPQQEQERKEQVQESDGLPSAFEKILVAFETVPEKKDITRLNVLKPFLCDSKYGRFSYEELQYVVGTFSYQQYKMYAMVAVWENDKLPPNLTPEQFKPWFSSSSDFSETVRLISQSPNIQPRSAVPLPSQGIQPRAPSRSQHISSHSKMDVAHMSFSGGHVDLSASGNSELNVSFGSSAVPRNFQIQLNGMLVDLKDFPVGLARLITLGTDYARLTRLSSDGLLVECYGDSQFVFNNVVGSAFVNIEMKSYARPKLDLLKLQLVKRAEVAAAAAYDRKAAKAKADAEAKERAATIQDRKKWRDALPDEEKECVVCFDKQRSGHFVPCGHFICCEVCGPVCNDCPKCRTKGTKFLSVQEIDKNASFDQMKLFA